MAYSVLKRGADLVLSVVAIVVLSPVFVLITLILRFSGEGEVFYRQQRIGFQNKSFAMWKFVTMLKDSPNIGTRDISIEGDPRVLPVGRWLRKTKLNEIPQLFNIVRGEMSFVGPRPLLEVSFQALEPTIQRRIFSVRPGLTGIASVVFRDENEIIAESKLGPREGYYRVILPYKGRLEIWYQEHASFWVDLKIVFLTAWVVIFPKSRLVFRCFKEIPRCEGLFILTGERGGER
ncbi:MAG TPA: sugar transferase [Nitrospira sp.]|nr:sugar transferase [Nitrospira sp.]HNI20421.1 sugar transferase [Nitrospira sp.]HNI67054.1 sugar transferase [Nitrospira sp.]HNL88216.1 sugar transferase [Nitrospira sp.]